MIIDAHCHLFHTWPFSPMEPSLDDRNVCETGPKEVPDSATRASVDALIHDMDRNGVDRAAIICIPLDRNPDNNDYVAEAVSRFPDRFHQFADLDGSRSDTYHTTGAAERLEGAVRRYGLRGFTHYIRRDDDGSWYVSPDGLALFAKAAELRQIASISCPDPNRLQPVMRQLAERFPSVPFLFHHMAAARAAEQPPYPRLTEILASAQLPNVYLKLSNYPSVSQVPWDYPYPDTGWIVRSLYEHYGPDRLCWGSDWPVVKDAMTYRQSIEVFQRHCSFVSDDHKARIFGGNFERLIARSGVV